MCLNCSFTYVHFILYVINEVPLCYSFSLLFYLYIVFCCKLLMRTILFLFTPPFKCLWFVRLFYILERSFLHVCSPRLHSFHSHWFLWCKAEFSASLLESSVSHNPSEIILICWFGALLLMLNTAVLLNIFNGNCETSPPPFSRFFDEQKA